MDTCDQKRHTRHPVKLNYRNGRCERVQRTDETHFYTEVSKFWEHCLWTKSEIRILSRGRIRELTGRSHRNVSICGQLSTMHSLHLEIMSSWKKKNLDILLPSNTQDFMQHHSIFATSPLRSLWLFCPFATAPGQKSHRLQSGHVAKNALQHWHKHWQRRQKMAPAVRRDTQEIQWKTNNEGIAFKIKLQFVATNGCNEKICNEHLVRYKDKLETFHFKQVSVILRNFHLPWYTHPDWVD